MDLMMKRRIMMIPVAGQTANYLIYGNPTINGTSYIPDTSLKGFIYTNAPFNPDTSGWVIQTKVKINTAVASRDIFASVDVDGNGQYSVAVRTNTNNSNTGYGLYQSSNGTSWNMNNNTPKGVMGLDTWRVFQAVCTRSGNSYIYKMGYPELDAWTTTSTKSAHPVYGKYIAFGGGFSSACINAEFDLSETKIWIGGNLWWTAIS